MRELSVKCRNNNLVLSVDVPPPYSFNEHYSQKELGEVVDYVIIMGYDEHYVGSDAGSVSPRRRNFGRARFRHALRSRMYWQ